MKTILDDLHLLNKNEIYGIAKVTSGDTSENEEFAIVDEKGHAVLSVKNGNLRTKNFSSSDVVSGAVLMNNDNSDFSISDEDGNVLAMFVSGSIVTRQVKGLRLDVAMEGGDIDSSGKDSYTISSFSNRRSSYFIKTGNAKYVFVRNEVYLYKYNSSHVLQNVILVSASNYADITGATYVRFVIKNNSDIESIPVFFIGGDAKEEKKVQMRFPSDRLLYKVDGEIVSTGLLRLPPNYSVDGKKVPIIIWDSGDGSFVNWNTYEMGDEGSAIRRTGLNYLLDQGFALLQVYGWGSYYYQKYPTCGMRTSMASHTHMEVRNKCVEYVLKRYNVDPDNIYHISKSGGGTMSLYYALCEPSFKLNSIYAFAPVFDDLNFLGIGLIDYRRAMIEELNLQGTTEELNKFYNGNTVAEGAKTNGQYIYGYNENYVGLPVDDPTLLATFAANRAFIEKNIEKFHSFAAGWINLVGQTIVQKWQDTLNFGEIFWDANVPKDSPSHETDCYNRYDLMMLSNKIPIKVIMSKDDEQTPYWNCAEVVSQLRNGGKDSTIVTLTTQGHAAPDSGTGVNAVSDVTTLLGVHYDSVSIGWYLACKDIQERFLSHSDQDVYDYLHP